MDDSTFPAVLEALQEELAGLLRWVATPDGVDLAAGEYTVRDGVRAIGRGCWRRG